MWHLKIAETKFMKSISLKHLNIASNTQTNNSRLNLCNRVVDEINNNDGIVIWKYKLKILKKYLSTLVYPANISCLQSYKKST